MGAICVHCDKQVAPEEFVSLMIAAGWGDQTSYDSAQVRRSIESYPFVAHARADDGLLVGYVSAFSDGAFSVLLGELVVHPDFQRQGVGSRLLRAVESHHPGVPVYVKPFVDQQTFFERNGYSLPRRSMAVLFKRNAHSG
jgi:GNAT superfamily N-acetyltransferase